MNDGAILSLFLGPAFERAHPSMPASMLGLPASPRPDDRAVFDQLARLTARIDAHPLAASPLAARARLLLNDAARQLQSPISPAARLTPGITVPPLPPSPPIPPPPTLPLPRPQPKPAPTQLPPEHIELLALAGQLITRAGRLDDSVLSQLRAHARARALPDSVVADVITRLSRGSASGLPDRAAPRNPAASALTTLPAPTSSAPGDPAIDFDAQADEPNPADRLIGKALLACAALAVVLVGGFILLLAIIGPPPVPAPPAPPSAAADTPGSTTTAATDAPGPDANPSPADELSLASAPEPNAVVRALRLASEAVATDPAAGSRRFATAAPVFLAWWPRLDSGQRVSATGHVADYLIAATRQQGLAPDAIALLSAPAQRLADPAAVLEPGQIAPTAASLALLSRLAREPELPPELARSIQAHLTAAFGSERPLALTRFEDALGAALAILPPRLVGDAGHTPPVQPDQAVRAADRWEECVRAWAGSPSTSTNPSAPAPDSGTPPAPAPSAPGDRAEPLLLDAIDRFLLAPTPAAGQPASTTLDSTAPARHAAAAALAARLRFRQGEPSRDWLLDRLDDGRIPSPAIAALTESIVNRSAAPNVDPTLIVPASASPADRSSFRERWASAWDAGPASTSADRTPLSRQWAQAARDALAAATRSASAADHLDHTARLAQLNLVAWARQRGDPILARSALAQAQLLSSTRQQPNQSQALLTITLSRGGTDPFPKGGQWAERYLAGERTEPALLLRLQELSQATGDLGQADADVLIQEALLAAAPSIRDAARDAAIRRSDLPVVINALLRALPKVRRTQSNSDLIARLTLRSLPPFSADDFPIQARKATVERLLELLAATADISKGVDAAALRIATAYHAAAYSGSSATTAPAPPDGVSSPPGTAARDAAAALWRTARQQADRFVPNSHAHRSIDLIQQRHAARLAIAKGELQQFAADQAAIADVLAYAAAGESPARAPLIRAELDRLDAARRNADSLSLQLRLTEESILRLWLIRFGEEVPPQ